MFWCLSAELIGACTHRPLTQDSVHAFACADRRRCVLLVRLELVFQTSLQQCHRTSCVFMSVAIGDHVPWEVMFVHIMCHMMSWHSQAVGVQSHLESNSGRTQSPCAPTCTCTHMPMQLLSHFQCHKVLEQTHLNPLTDLISTRFDVVVSALFFSS